MKALTQPTLSLVFLLIAAHSDSWAATREPLDIRAQHSAKSAASLSSSHRIVRPDIRRLPALPSHAPVDMARLGANSIWFHVQSLGALPRQGAELQLIDQQRLRGGSHIVRTKPMVDGVEVFAETYNTLIDKTGQAQMISGVFDAAVGSLGSPRQFQLDAKSAVEIALLEEDVTDRIALSRQTNDSNSRYLSWETGFEGTQRNNPTLAREARSKPVMFRMPGGFEPAYYVETQVRPDLQTPEIFMARVISAKTGAVLFRMRQEADETFNYRVWASATTPFTPAAGPVASFLPHPTGTPDGSVPAFVPSSLVSLESGPIATNDPWLPAGTRELRGNNADAYADLAAPDGYSLGDHRVLIGTAPTFDFTYDHNLAPNANLTQASASTVQLFYTVNWLHDWFYGYGFDEASGNAQNNNYGRGGLGSDSMRAEDQDSAGNNNANMSTPADGARPRMQMFNWTGRGNSSMTLTPGSSPAAVGSASFGPVNFNVTGTIVRANDGAGVADDACTSVPNVSGALALVQRGTCTFVVKAANAQAGGAVGMIVYNNAAGTIPPGLGGTDPSITIPLLSVTQADGQSIIANLASGPITATMVRTTDPNRDGGLDNLIVAHEWGHYISNRLIGDAAGLGNLMGRGMGEGWADFHALIMGVPAGANPDGVYSASLYSSSGSFSNQPDNGGYFGIRRFPYSRDLSKNGLSFRHISDGTALPATPIKPNVNPNSQVHNTGEVWATMLWECYAGLIADSARLTFAQAQDRMSGYLVASYKMTPINPTLIEARDALLGVIAAESPEDLAICAAGFAKRGAGLRAQSPDRFSLNNTPVVESIMMGGDLQAVSASLTDVGANCDNDGILDRGETGTLTLRVRNSGFTALSAANAEVSSPELNFPSGTSVNLPATLPNEVVSATLPVSLLQGLDTRFVTQVTVTPDHPDLAFTTGVPVTSASALHFDVVNATSTTERFESNQFLWTRGLQGLTDNAARWDRLANLPDNFILHGPDFGSAGVTWVQTPALNVASSGDLIVTFSARHDFEVNAPTFWDGGVVEISTDGTSFTDIGASITPTYGGAITNTSGNPFGTRNAFVARNAAYPAFNDYTINLGSTYAGQTVFLRFSVGTDLGTGAGGWDIDNVNFSGIVGTPFATVIPDAGQCLAPAIFANGFE